MMEFDLEEEIRACPEIMDKIKNRDNYAQNLYAAFCNMRWCKRDVWPVLKEEYWSCSWRSAGGIVADLINRGGDYMDWYCSGMGGVATYDLKEGEEYMSSKQYVPEGIVTDEIATDLNKLGWFPVPWPKDD